MKILLVNPPVKKVREPLHDTPLYYHTGLAHIYSLLKKFTKQDVEFIDCKFHKINEKELIDNIKIKKPDIIGFTAKTLEIDHVIYLSGKIKEISPDVKIILGGAHVSGDHSFIKENSIDFIIKGEGESAFLELLNALEGSKDFTKVRSLVYKESNLTRENPIKKSEKNHIVPVRWQDFPAADKYYIMALRGCPQRCVFCMRVLGNKVFYRDYKDVISEIGMILSINPNAEIEFSDETFTVSGKYIKKIISIIIEKGLNKFSGGFIASTRIDRLDKEILVLLKKGNFKRLIVGLESGDKQVLKNSKKDIFPEKALKICRLIKRSGIELEANFMVGLPGENINSIIKTAVFAARVRADNISVSIACPYPGTELSDYVRSGKFSYVDISSTYADFNNELGNAVEFSYMKRWMLEFAQLFIYVFSFLGTFRFKDFFIFCLKYPREAREFVKKLFSK